MVSLSDITLNNTSLQSPDSRPGSGPIAALIGCTSGIGLSTLQALLKHTSSPTIYLVGRDSARLDALISAVQPLNRTARLHAIVGADLTLVLDAQHAASQIASHAARLDLLLMSAGYLSASGTARFSPEGLDRLTAIRVHSRMRMLVTLLPLLRRSRSPRVLSVLAGGREGSLALSDLSMARPDTYGPLYATGAAASMTTLFFEHVATRPGNERIVFAHVFPGVVGGTGLELRDAGVVVRCLWQCLAKPLMWLLGYSAAEVGERVLFVATNGRFRRLPAGTSAVGTLIQQGSDGVQGSGVYLVNADSSVVAAGGNPTLRALRAQGAGQKVYDYLMAEFDRIGALGV